MNDVNDDISSARVIWDEGLFLRPQHFQQMERFLEYLIETRCSSAQPLRWGITEVKIDDALLKQGKFGISRCAGILPDGTPFSAGKTDPLPLPLEIGGEVRSQCVFIGVPQRSPHTTQFENDSGGVAQARFRRHKVAVNDITAQASEPTSLDVGRLKIRLGLEKREILNLESAGLSYLPIARVAEKQASGEVKLEADFIPPVLHYGASDVLVEFIKSTIALLQHRADNLAARYNPRSGGAKDIADFLFLQVLNRFDPLFEHFARNKDFHPEELFRLATQFAGELSTFVKEDRRAGRKMPVTAPGSAATRSFPEYLHSNLRDSFIPLREELRSALSTVLENNAVAVEIQKQQYGLHLATVGDRSLFKTARFYLAIASSLQEDVVRYHAPRQVKVGPMAYIKQLVNTQTTGISLKQSATVPREIPYHAGFSYFELERSNPRDSNYARYWGEAETSGALYVHIPDNFPDLKLELWAVRAAEGAVTP